MMAVSSFFCRIPPYAGILAPPLTIRTRRSSSESRRPILVRSGPFSPPVLSLYDSIGIRAGKGGGPTYDQRIREMNGKRGQRVSR